MSLPTLKSSCAALLLFLDQLSPFSGDDPSIALSTQQRTTLDEHRKHVDYITERLQTCSWIIATLLHSLDEIRKTRTLLMEKQAQVLDKANQLVAGSQRTIHLPNEILSLIAHYMHPNPISMEEAVRLGSSGRKWDQVVLKASLIEVDGKAIRSPSLPEYLSVSSPAKLVVNLSGFISVKGLQSLLPFSGRWHSFSVGVDWDEDILIEALLAVPCPKCPNDMQRNCEGHSLLSPLRNLTVSHTVLRSFSGLLTNIRHLCLLVSIIDVEETALDFYDLEGQVPFLSELTVLWRTWMEAVPGYEDLPRTFFPSLKRIVFIQEGPACPKSLEFAFGALDVSEVEDLSVHILNPHGEWLGDELEMTDYLGDVFSSVRSFSLRVQPGIMDDTVMLQPQTGFLEMLVPGLHGKTVFPHLTHLSLELDQTQEGLDTLLRVLHERHDHKGPSLEEIRSVDLFTDYSESQSDDPYEIVSRVSACVQQLTVCSTQIY